MPDMIRTVMVEQKMMYEEQIAQLRAERDEARLASVRFMEKMADILNDEANAEIEQLRKERDEARRKICEMEAECIVHPPCSPQQYAVRMGWDCFSDKTEADANNTLFRTTDGE
jgi:DNA-binding protein H-NS